MQTLTIAEEAKLSSIHIKALRKLWNKEYPLSLNYEREEDFILYLMRLEKSRHYLLKNEEGDIFGWAFDFTRDNERWFGILVDSEVQGRKFGTALLNTLKENNPSLNGWMIDRDTDIKSNGAFYKSPVHFYKKNGFILKPLEHMGFDKISAIKINWTNKN